MNRKHWGTIAATITLASTLVVGCGTTSNTTTNNTSSGGNSSSPTTSSGKTTITFYEAMPGELGKELKTLTQKFEANHPSIHVDLIYNGSYSTQEQKLTAALAAHDAPTIAQVEETWESKYFQNGLLTELGKYLPQSTVQDLIPIWRKDSSYNGKLVSVPFNKSAYVLYYNTSDFKKAGIKKPPTTWSQLESDAIKLTKSGVPGIGMQANYYQFEMFLHQAGGKDLNSSNTKAAFGGSAGKTALNFMYQLADVDKAAKIVSENGYLSNGFNTNEYAMDLDTTAALSFINNPSIHFKVAPLPRGTQAAVPTAGTNIVLFKSATPAQKKAAIRYLAFLISKKTTIEWAEKTGYLPVRESALTDPTWISYTASHPDEGVAPKELKHAFYSPRVAALESGMTEATTQIGNCISMHQSVSVTLQKMVQAINEALQNG
ncbi:MAG: ABC transporter substrate-binding protein [Alicyclobacillaceae bacterium]|nr:ABC transporter substrate-binding protein [Alicyclobacillaceae bacterium]